MILAINIYDPLDNDTRTKDIIDIYTRLYIIVPFNLRLCFMNYDCVFRSYDCVLYVKNVLFMQSN